MSTDTADVEVPEVEAATPDVAPATPDVAAEPKALSLDEAIAEAFGAPEAEGESEDGPARDEKGRFVSTKEADADEAQAPEADNGDAEPASNAEPEGTPEPAPRRIITAKVDKETREVDIDEWWGDETKRGDLTNLVQKGMAFDDATQRRYTAGVQDIVNALSAQGYSVVRDTLAPGGVRVVPPAATTPPANTQPAPAAADPITTLGQQIEALEAEIAQSQEPSVADFLRLQKLQRELSAAQTEAIRSEQAKRQREAEESRQREQQQALAQEFQRRVGGLIQQRSKAYGADAEAIAAEASALAHGRTFTARTIEEVEQTIRAHFDRMDAYRRPAPKPETPKAPPPAATKPQTAKKPQPVPVGSAGTRTVAQRSDPFAEAKTFDDLKPEDWSRIIPG